MFSHIVAEHFRRYVINHYNNWVMKYIWCEKHDFIFPLRHHKIYLLTNLERGVINYFYYNIYKNIIKCSS